MDEMLKDYARLVKLAARVDALMDYINGEKKYNIEPEKISDILCIPLKEVKDGESGEQDAD